MYTTPAAVKVPKTTPMAIPAIAPDDSTCPLPCCSAVFGAGAEVTCKAEVEVDVRGTAVSRLVEGLAKEVVVGAGLGMATGTPV